MKLEWSDGIIYVIGGKHQYPKHEGVYVIAKKIDGKKKARYVGRGNIYDRMKVHESDDEPNSCLKKVMSDRDNLVVHYAKVPNQTERENAERTLFDYFGGAEKLCNEVMPEGQFIPTMNVPFIKEIDAN